MQNNVIYFGLLGAKYGYGEAARGYKAIIDDQELPVDVLDLSNAKDWARLTDADISKRTIILHKRPTGDLSPRDMEIIFRAKRVIYMTVWECDGVSNSWKPFLKDINTIIVPSEYSAMAFRKEWPNKKIYVLPHLVNPFRDTIRFADIPQDRINVLSIVSQLTGRKGIDNVVSAFHCLPEQLAKKSRLVIKGTKGTTDFCKRMIIDYNKPEIIVKEDYMSDADMDRLLMSVDILFSPNRGEGFGIDIVRSAYLGIDIVATNKGGYMDYIANMSNFFPIPAEFDYAYCKSTYHDTDIAGLMWPSPTIKACTDTLGFCLRGVGYKKYSIEEVNTKIEKHNNGVTEIFKSILKEVQ